MTIVDTHCHVGLLKYEPIESLLYMMNASGVEKAVFIQYAGNADNSYMLECMAKHPGKFQAAMIVEPEDDGTKVREWAEKGCVGIRLPLASRAKASDPLAHWRAADELGLIVSAPSNPTAMLSDEFAEVLAAFPDLQIVIEHLGGVGANAEPPYDQFKEALKLAERPNLTIKMPGFGEICEVPMPFDNLPPTADMAVEAFGPDRVMWGSDYPPVSRREGYANSLSAPMSHFATLSDDEREAIFSATAMRVWKFEA